MREKKFKKLTILHSNDMHGDFQAEHKVVATTVLDVLEEILCQMELLVCPEDERWVMMP